MGRADAGMGMNGMGRMANGGDVGSGGGGGFGRASSGQAISGMVGLMNGGGEVGGGMDRYNDRPLGSPRMHPGMGSTYICMYIHRHICIYTYL